MKIKTVYVYITDNGAHKRNLPHEVFSPRKQVEQVTEPGSRKAKPISVQSVNKSNIRHHKHSATQTHAGLVVSDEPFCFDAFAKLDTTVLTHRIVKVEV